MCGYSYVNCCTPANIASTSYARIYFDIACLSLCKSRDRPAVRVIAVGEGIGPQRGSSALWDDVSFSVSEPPSMSMSLFLPI